MRYLGWLLLLAAAVWALGWAHGIRTTYRTGGSLTQQTVNIGMLMAASVIAILLLGASPLHLLWMFPASFLLGALSLAFPFSLLSVPGRLYGALATFGLDSASVAHDQAEHQALQRVGPKELAYTAVALAGSHLKVLGNEVQDASEAHLTAVFHELLRAYFGLASLRAGQSISDVTELNRYGAAMLESLRAYPEEGGDLIRPAFNDRTAVDYAVRLYVQSRPAAEDHAAAQASKQLLRLDQANALLMLCAYAHIRTMRPLAIGKGDIRFLALWALNAERFISGFKEVLGAFRPGY